MGNFEAVVKAFSDNPDQLVATGQYPCIFFIRDGIFFINKEIAQLFETRHAKRLKIFTFVPVAKDKGKNKLIQIQIYYMGKSGKPEVRGSLQFFHC